ncbi:hypothetical protein V8C43DRAFT_270917 [Trichoderma afarasin]
MQLFHSSIQLRGAAFLSGLAAILPRPQKSPGLITHTRDTLILPLPMDTFSMSDYHQMGDF